MSRGGGSNGGGGLKLTKVYLYFKIWGKLNFYNLITKKTNKKWKKF